VSYGDCCELVGYALPGDPVHRGESVHLTLVWRALRPTDKNYSLFVHARTADGKLVGQVDTFHGGGMFPTSQWHTGEIFADSVQVPISWEAAPPAVIRFHVGLYDLGSMERLPALSSGGATLQTVVAGEAGLVPSRWPQARLDPATGTVFEEKVRLAVAELPQPIVHPGDVVTVTLEWEALVPITEDYTGFVHLVDASGNHVAQEDHPPLEGRFPTRVWPQGAAVYDSYRLVLSPDVQEGNYHLAAGLYRPQSKQRLQAIRQKTGERWSDDLVQLGTVIVTEDGQ